MINYSKVNQFEQCISQSIDLAYTNLLRIPIIKYIIIHCFINRKFSKYITCQFCIITNFLFNQLHPSTSCTSVKSTGLVLPLIQNNLGIGILPLDYVSEDIRQGKIIQIKMTDLPPSRDIYIATNPLTAPSAIGQEFYKFAKEQ